MGLKRTDEFRADAVRIALASRLTRKQVADDPLPGRVFSKEMPREGGCWHVDTEQMDHVASTAGQWMSGKGNCYDNAAPSRQICFANTLPGNGRDVLQNPFSGHCYAIPCQAGIKAELISRRSWETRRQAEMAIFKYINGFYNPRPSRDIRLANALPGGGRHSALGWKSPVAFERKVA